MRTSQDSPHSTFDSCGYSTWEGETGRRTRYRRGYFVKRCRHSFFVKRCRYGGGSGCFRAGQLGCFWRGCHAYALYSIASVQSVSEEDDAEPDLGGRAAK